MMKNNVNIINIIIAIQVKVNTQGSEEEDNFSLVSRFS